MADTVPAAGRVPGAPVTTAVLRCCYFGKTTLVRPEARHTAVPPSGTGRSRSMREVGTPGTEPAQPKEQTDRT